jgi:transcriptional regulator with XRE-family HTH domain
VQDVEPFRDRVQLGALISRVRARAGLTQAELAARIATTQSAVSRWERGHDEPRLSTLAAILRACGRTLTIGADDGVDRAQIREQLAMSPRQRLQSVANVSRTVSRAREVGG